jgi:hypothetical protein
MVVEEGYLVRNGAWNREHEMLMTTGVPPTLREWLLQLAVA